MTTSTLVILILILYMGVMVLVGSRAKRRIKNFDDAIAARGQTTLFVLIGSCIGMQIGSGFVIGGAEYGALYGIGGGWYGISCGLNHIVVAAVTCGFVYKHGYVSLADYFGDRYGGRLPRLIYSVATMLSCVAMIGGQLLAGKAVFMTLGFPEELGVIITAMISVAYVVTAGLWGTMAISTIQSTIIFIGMVGAAVVMLVVVGPEMLTENLPATYFDIQPFSGEKLVATLVPTATFGMIAQGMFQTTVSCESARTAKLGYLISGLMLIPIALVPALLGMFGRVMFPDLPAASVFMELLLTRLPVPVAALILAAIICAVLCSCNTAYMSLATSAVHNIYQGMINPNADSVHCRRLMIAVDLTACAIGVFLALRMSDIIQVMTLGYSMVTSGCVVPYLGGRLWKGGTGAGALAACFTGIGAVLANAMGLIQLPYPSVSAIVLSAAAFVLGSLLIKSKSDTAAT